MCAVHGADGLEEHPGPPPLPTYWWNKFSSSLAASRGRASSSHLLPIGTVLPPCPGGHHGSGLRGQYPHPAALGRCRDPPHLCSGW